MFEDTYENSPKVAEPFDELRGIVLVESHVGEVDLQHSRARIANVEEHQLRLAQVHWRQRACLNTASVKDESITELNDDQRNDYINN